MGREGAGLAGRQLPLAELRGALALQDPKVQFQVMSVDLCSILPFRPPSHLGFKPLVIRLCVRAQVDINLVLPNIVPKATKH